MKHLSTIGVQYLEKLPESFQLSANQVATIEASQSNQQQIEGIT